MAKSTTTRRGTKATPRAQVKPASRATSVSAATLTPSKAELAELEVGKITNQILMLAADAEGMTILINKADYEFFIEHDHPNYAAMVSTLLAAHASGAHVAVKYSQFSGIQSQRRRALAVAKGVHAVISGSSF